MNIIALIAGISFMVFGLYGVIKKKMIAPWLLGGKHSMGRTWEFQAAKNMSKEDTQNIKNYMIYGSYAIIEGIFFTIIGILIIFVNF